MGEGATYGVIVLILGGSLTAEVKAAFSNSSRSQGDAMKNTIQTLLLIFVVLLVLVGCAKKPKPWDNPELIKIDQEDLPLVFADVTFFGQVLRPNGQKGNRFKIYFKEDDTSEVWVHGMNTFDRGWWDTSDPDATYCNWFKNLNNGRKDCWLLYKVKGEDRYEYYYLNGKQRGVIHESRAGYHM